LAIALVEDEDLDLIVNGKYNQKYSQEDIKLFLHYFFKVDEWTLRDRQAFVNRVSEPQLSRYYRIALKGDKEFLLWKLGVTPNKDFKSMLAEIGQDSFYNFKENSRTNPETAQKWAAITLKVSERVDSMEKDEKRSKGDVFEEIEFKIKTFSYRDRDTKDNEIKHIQDLD